MSWLSRYNSGAFGAMKKLKEVKCTSDYFNYKDDIYQQISKISNKGQVHFCSRCESIKQYIIKRNNELNDCYSNKFLRNQLTDDSDIKNFINKCTVYSKCINNHQIRAERTSERKKSTEDPCKKTNTCRTGTASTKVTSKPKEVLETKTSEIIAPGRKDKSDQSQKHAEEADSKDEKIISEIESGKISSADSAGNSRELSASEDIQHSNTSGQGETSAQSSQILPHTTTGELDTLSGAPLKDNPIGEPQSRNSSEVLDSDEVVTDSGLNAHQGVATSSVPEQVVSGKAGYTPDSKDIGGITENSSIHGPVDRTDRNTDVVNTISIEGTSSDQNPSTGFTHDPLVNSDPLCNKTPCISGELSELTSGNENKQSTLGAIYEVIVENQGHMIKASIPMGIVLLLSLLFKYTPLWRILTKRKRKKQSHMNEKLQRVLQQPSIPSEERSIPFSYSAFEYSS
ncbi:hypothetical protein PVIIG_05380 [Plasmodium vivax India VII]|uniref:Variable surface protein Vir18 n=1 Tax=Plasmodium vivax India VII TaxID=1077284 RepID=A0A0J9S2I9_PLAVI|nr:hypothetical protein PVIIG_05380 [Plasmodium vivax India VII]